MPRVHYSLRLVLSGTILARSGAFWFGSASNADDPMASKDAADDKLALCASNEDW